MKSDYENPNPIVNIAPKEYSHGFMKERNLKETNENIEDEIDKYEVYDIIKNITDPEHPWTLEQINVVNVENISVDNVKKRITILFTPTIPNCSWSTVIGWSIKVKMINCVSRRYKTIVRIEPGKHILEDTINKQLADKERVFAALEAEGLKRWIDRTIRCDEEIEMLYQ